MELTEKYFIMSEDSEFVRDWTKYLENVEQGRLLVNEFLASKGIESHQYSPRTRALAIVPTENDKTNFGKDLCINSDEYGLIWFKMSSKIGKAWKALTSERGYRVMWPPSLSSYIGHGFRSSSRKFKSKDGIWYGSYETDCNFAVPDTFTEIKAWEFFKALEEYKPE